MDRLFRASGGLRSYVKCEEWNDYEAYSYGNTVLVSASVILKSKSEDELAFIIGHEIAHSAYCDDSSDARAEKRSDHVALEMLSRAGYSPWGGRDGLKRLQKEEQGALASVPLIRTVVELAGSIGRRQSHPYTFSGIWSVRREIYRHGYPKVKKETTTLKAARDELQEIRKRSEARI